MKKYDLEFNLQVVQSFLAGDGGAKLLARRWSVPEEKIQTWVSHYRLQGLDSLRPKRGAYSSQFKLEVLAHQDREQLSSRQVAAIYDIRNPNQVVVWRRTLHEGDAAMQGNGQQADPELKEQRPAVGTGTEPLNDPNSLREENERLRAEVAYLKKLQALIRAKRLAAPTRHG